MVFTEGILRLHRHVGILRGTTEWGKIEQGGLLGYPCSISKGKLICPRGIEPHGTISTHANAEVQVEFNEPTRIKGFLSGTAGWDPYNPVVFTVNHSTIGLLHKPLECTREVKVPAGKYTLSCICQKPPHGRHSAWSIEPDPEPVPARLAVLTVGRYPLAELTRKLQHFTHSSTRFNLLPEILGAGERTRSWYRDKIVDVTEAIEQLPSSVTHILFSDGSDSFLLDGEDRLISEFERFESSFVISMERGCWPVHDQEWRESFPRVSDGRRWPNAGGWMGTRQGTEAVLKECVDLYRDLKGEGLQGELTRWQKHARFAHDDQFLLQLAFKNGRVQMAGDTEHRIFTNVGTASRLLEGNPDYELCDGRVRSIATDTFPLVIHFSGGAWRECQEQWMAKLGIL